MPKFYVASSVAPTITLADRSLDTLKAAIRETNASEWTLHTYDFPFLVAEICKFAAGKMKPAVTQKLMKDTSDRIHIS